MPLTANRIQKLNSKTIAQIAAGEVVESPGSVLKELIENSIDAESDDIQVFVHNDGFGSIQVRDNGAGILKEDLPLALEGFTTSKLNNIDDLMSIESFGFRGEALGAISAVANVVIESKDKGSEYAYSISKESNSISEVSASSLAEGTKIIVTDLFCNLPVRKEFIKNVSKLKKEILDTVTYFALAYPEISFRLYYDDKLLVNVQRMKNLSERIQELFSLEFLDSLLPCYYKNLDISVEGHISNFRFFRSSPDLILLFINKRVVRYSKLIKILRQVYGEMLPLRKFPIAFLFLNISPQKIDINVHPQKKEIRFKEEIEAHALLKKATLNALEARESLRAKNLPRKKNNSRKEYPVDFSTPLNVQEARGMDVALKLNQPEVSSLSEVEQDPEIKYSTLISQDVNPKLFSEFKLHGKLYNTFIMASAEEGIYLFDQHTVHERINFEEFLDKFKKNEDIKQYLVSLIPIKLSLSETELVKRHQKTIERLGFCFEEIGPSNFGLTSVPFYIGSGREEEAFQIFLKKLEDQDGSTPLGFSQHEALFKDLAASLACRQAIKKGDPEPLSYLKELIEKLQQCRNPMRCPHGRPTMVFIGKEEISRLFKRFK